jgi:hypothetical protein
MMTQPLSQEYLRSISMTALAAAPAKIPTFTSKREPTPDPFPRCKHNSSTAHPFIQTTLCNIRNDAAPRNNLGETSQRTDLVPDPPTWRDVSIRYTNARILIPPSSIGGFAIRESSSDNVGQPRVRFPADVLNSSSGACPFASFLAQGLENGGTRSWSWLRW